MRENARIPVIETGAGICHTYFDEFGDTRKGADIIHNAKTRRVSVCNALDCTIIHEKRLGDLPALCDQLKESKVTIYADTQAYQHWKDIIRLNCCNLPPRKASEQSFWIIRWLSKR